MNSSITAGRSFTKKFPRWEVFFNKHLLKLQNELGSYFDGTLNQFLVPIDVDGTKYEKRVWNKLLKIPYGETRSYGEIASEL
ncbi:MAG: MGMT family protein, partial [Bacteroidetes bacterium]|nr:MGMT family protein [Bacteroidota bacterium]